MRIRQSTITLWQSCPLKYRFAYLDGLPRLQSGSLSYGSIVHACIEYMEIHRDLAGASERFLSWWDDPTLLDPEYKIEYFVRGTNWKSYRAQGPKLLEAWWDLYQWDVDTVVGRELHFIVPIGDGHELEGTIDKLVIRYDPALGRFVLVVVDFKTTKKQPTQDDLAESIQFSAYAYATTRPEFWTGVPNGQQLFEQMKDAPRFGEWIQLHNGPKRISAGQRGERHYGRLALAVNEIARSLQQQIFVPTISGASCTWCDFREQCGLPRKEAA